MKDAEWFENMIKDMNEFWETYEDEYKGKSQLALDLDKKARELI